MKRNFYLTLIAHLLILWPTRLQAENMRLASDPKLDLRSPSATVQTHFMLLSPGNKSLRNIKDLFMHNENYPGENREIAIKLKKLLTIYRININTIDKDPNYIDPVVNEYRYILSKKLPLVYLVKQGDAWKYSEDTVIFINQYQDSFKLDELLYNFLPKAFCRQKILDLFIWQYIVFFSLFIIIWVINKIMPYFFKYVLYRFITASQRKQFNIERLLVALVDALLIKVIFSMLQLSGWEVFINRILESLISFLVMYFNYECIGIIQYKIKSSNLQSKFTMHVLPIYSMLAKIIVIVYGLIKTADNFGIGTDSLVKVLSFFTLGLGLAAQDTIKNLFGSLMIVMTRPFHVGDDIASGTIRGRVEDIGLRATLLRTKEGSLVYIPNAKLVDTAIDNFGKRNLRMIHLEIPLNYTTSLDVLSKFVRGLRAIAKRQSFVIQDKTELHFDNMGSDGFIILLSLYLDSPEAKVERQCKHSVIGLILQMAHYLELRIGKIKNVSHIKEHNDVEEQVVTKTDIEKLLEEATKEEG